MVFDKTDFTGTSTTITHDHAGNLIVDGSFVYIYDAWNRLVAVKSQADTDITIQTAEFDGTGRRMKKVVTNAGDLDGTVVYLYDGWKIAETRVGTSPTTYHQQFIHGTQYIDELIMVRAIDKGDLYIHQDDNWNVIGTTDLAASIVERNVYTPYGQLTVHQETNYGDRDGDGDVDATDKGTPGSTCTGTVTGACRILDLDFDGDYDSTDADNFDALTQGIARHQGRTTTATDQPFAHQGLLFEPELASYQNRHRQYAPSARRFVQRDSVSEAFAVRRILVSVSARTNLYVIESGAQSSLINQAYGLAIEDDARLDPMADSNLVEMAGILQDSTNAGITFELDGLDVDLVRFFRDQSHETNAGIGPSQGKKACKKHSRDCAMIIHQKSFLFFKRSKLGQMYSHDPPNSPACKGVDDCKKYPPRD